MRRLLHFYLFFFALRLYCNCQDALRACRVALLPVLSSNSCSSCTRVGHMNYLLHYVSVFERSSTSQCITPLFVQRSVAGVHAASRLSHSFQTQSPCCILHSNFHNFLIQFITAAIFAFNLLAQLRFLVLYHLLCLLSLLFFIAKTTMAFVLFRCCTLSASIVYTITGCILSVSSTAFDLHFIYCPYVYYIYVYILPCIF